MRRKVSIAWHSSTKIPAVEDWPFQITPDTKLVFNLEISNQQRPQQPFKFHCMSVLSTNLKITANALTKAGGFKSRALGILKPERSRGHYLVSERKIL